MTVGESPPPGLVGGSRPLHFSIAVAPATTADLPDLVALSTDATNEQRHERGGRVWAGREARLDPEVSLGLALADARFDVLAGRFDDVVVGFVVMREDRLADGSPLGVIEDIVVTPEARGVGVGEALIDAAIDAARLRGCVGVDALVLPGNRASKNFFETAGLTARAIVVHRALTD